MIRISNLAIQLGSFRLEGISMEIPTGEYGVLMGKTGCGKTTILECLCGLRMVHSGKIMVAGTEVTRLRPAERNIGYVPQDGALFPTMTVREHLEFPLRIRKWEAGHIRRRTLELADLLHIEYLLDRRPAGLSGGESQRVALGRALAFEPSTLILDEPLSALDDQTRERMYGLLKKVQLCSGVTALHITHSREEAGHLADRMFTLEAGRIRQVDPPEGADKESEAEAEETHWT